MRLYSVEEMRRSNGQRFLVVLARAGGTHTVYCVTVGDFVSSLVSGLSVADGRIAFGILESDMITSALDHAPEEKARAEAIRAEIERRAAKRAAALAKLDEEERELLGVEP